MMVAVAVMVMAMVATNASTTTAMTSSTHTSVSQSIITQTSEIKFITAVYKNLCHDIVVYCNVCKFFDLSFTLLLNNISTYT